jgi:hypothetical protein
MTQATLPGIDRSRYQSMKQENYIKLEIFDLWLAEMPYSEWAMHMKVAGKPLLCKLLPAYHNNLLPGKVQTYKLDGRLNGHPCTEGEAGVYSDSRGAFAYGLKLPDIPIASSYQGDIEIWHYPPVKFLVRVLDSSVINLDEIERILLDCAKNNAIGYSRYGESAWEFKPDLLNPLDSCIGNEHGHVVKLYLENDGG